MKKALKQLIDALDRIFEEHEEVGDTAVREFMYAAVHRSFIVPQPGYTLPAEFGMFSEEGNRRVCAALTTFLTHSEVLEAATRLNTAKERLDGFQDHDVESEEGNRFDEYFGYAESPGLSLVHGPQPVAPL